ncbi:hypothetical protein Avbf_02340 [Armadillidium vulgare]|nr:hypothetical protein Avbf_02340 [Armadillidium vulgare]
MPIFFSIRHVAVVKVSNLLITNVKNCCRSLSFGSLQQRSPSLPGNSNCCEALLPGELAKHAVSEGTKAMFQYPSNPSK